MILFNHQFDNYQIECEDSIKNSLLLKLHNKIVFQKRETAPYQTWNDERVKFTKLFGDLPFLQPPLPLTVLQLKWCKKHFPKHEYLKMTLEYKYSCVVLVSLAIN